MVTRGRGVRNRGQDFVREGDEGVITLDIEALSSNGEGIARHEGLVHFVPRTPHALRAYSLVAE